MKYKREQRVDNLFPNGQARRAADAAIDKLDVKESMVTFLDVWENEYFKVAKTSPFRKPKGL